MVCIRDKIRCSFIGKGLCRTNCKQKQILNGIIHVSFLYQSLTEILRFG